MFQSACEVNFLCYFTLQNVFQNENLAVIVMLKSNKFWSKMVWRLVLVYG